MNMKPYVKETLKNSRNNSDEFLNDVNAARLFISADDEQSESAKEIGNLIREYQDVVARLEAVIMDWIESN